MVKIILASQSPRRTEILSTLGIRHEIEVADIDETPQPDEKAEALVCRLAKEKAMAVGAHKTEGYVIGSDTIVVLDGQVLGKPRDEEHALEMLQALSGRVHQVMTGVAVYHGPTQEVAVELMVTKVTMSSFGAREAKAYIATGEPMDKAGAYGIQGIGGVFIDHIEGEFYSVAGLSVQALIKAFGDLGLDYFEDIRQ